MTGKITIRYLGRFSTLSGKLQEEMRLASSESLTVQALMERLGSKYGASFREALFDEQSGSISSFVLIMHNSRQLSFTDYDKAALKNGDVVTIMEPISGG